MQFTTLKSNSASLRRHRASWLEEFAMMRINLMVSLSVQIGNRLHSKYSSKKKIKRSRDLSKDRNYSLEDATMLIPRLTQHMPKDEHSFVRLVGG